MKKMKTDVEIKGHKTSLENTKHPVKNEDIEDITNKQNALRKCYPWITYFAEGSFNMLQRFKVPLLGPRSQYSVMKNRKFVQIFLTTWLIRLLSEHLIVKMATLIIIESGFF